jgi:hypothetical protein
MWTKTAFNFPLFLLLFLGISAIFGGSVLIISPTGELLGIPIPILSK